MTSDERDRQKALEMSDELAADLAARGFRADNNDEVARRLSQELAADLGKRGFRAGDDEGTIPVTDPVARTILRNLRAGIDADKAAQDRYERSLRGRLATYGWWPDGNGWAWVALFAVLVISMLMCAYAGYLEATAPLPPDAP